MGKPKPPPKTYPPIGWREWVTLPDLGIDRVKAKIDTGARSSALHAFKIKVIEEDGRKIVTFQVHPLQRDSKTTFERRAELLEYREVRSSGGHVTRRPVILTPVSFQGEQWPIELTLVSRDSMGFRMLLGREAIRGRYFVDPLLSYYGGQPERPKKPRKKSVRQSKKSPKGTSE